jgi:hypothetical protein
MEFKEEILMNIYRIITLSQYLYNAPLLGSASTQAKKETEKQQHRFYNIIGITSAELEVYKIDNKYTNPRKAESTTPEYITVNSRLKTAG